MAFPSSPINGQVATVNGIAYTYSSGTRSWARVQGSVANLVVQTTLTTGGNVTANALTVNSTATISGTLRAAGGIQNTPIGNVTASTGAFTSITASANITLRNNNVVTNYTGNTAPSNPRQGDEWYYVATDTLYKYLNDGTSNVWVSLSSALYNANTGAVANTLALRDSGGNLTATNFLGVASSAKYADLAEVYESDNNYEPGTVVVFGGNKEITVTDNSHDTRVAGVISTNPAYLMNSEATGLPVAFTGRVPCFVKGPVEKGELLVSSSVPGVAQALEKEKYQPGSVFGKSLSNLDTNDVKLIEVVVGRY